MSASLSSIGWGITLLVGLLYILVWLLGGGFFNYAKSAAALLPVLVVALMPLRRHWHVMITAALALDYVVVPLYGLQRLTPLLIISLLTGTVLLMDLAREKRLGRASGTWMDRVVFLLGLIVTARFFVNRPGFAALGMESGGFTNGLFIAAGPWCYFVARTALRSGECRRSQIWAIAGVSLTANLLSLVLAPAAPGTFWARKLALSPSWLMSASILALCVTADAGLRKWFAYYAVAGVMVALGLISDYRARLYFFLGQIGISSYFGAFLKQTLILAGVGVVALAGWIMVGRGGRVPEVMERSMSVFMDPQRTVYARGGAMGWQDTTRAKLYGLAWEEIKRSPVFGSGFGLSVESALAILAVYGTTGGAALELLAWSGGYHNSVVLAAAKAGLPAALLFTVVSLILPWRFWGSVRRSRDPAYRVWGYMLIGFWWANTGMMLLNGGPKEFFVAMVVNGLLAGMLAKTQPVPENSRVGVPPHASRAPVS